MRRTLILVIVMMMIVSFASADKLGAKLQDRLNNITRSEKLPVLVVFEGLPSFNEVAQEYRFLGEKEIVKQQVIRVLKEKVNNIQHWVKQLCATRAASNQISNTRSLWVVNAMKMQATASAIQEIANQPGVSKIVLDEPVPMLLNTRELTWGVQKINAPAVWGTEEEPGYTGKGVLVAVIDTGVNKHEDFKKKLNDEYRLIYDKKFNYINPDEIPTDDHAHGTHCAGTVAGNGRAGSQTGVAPQADILAVKVLGGNGSGSWGNLWSAIEDVIGYKDDSVKVISMSLGGNTDDTNRKLAKAACDKAIGAGLIPVIAAGNSGSSPRTVGTPGDVEDVITIGATTSSDGIAYFSSRGPVTWVDGKEYVKPDVSAPGYSVKSCSHTNQSGYKSMSGTSMATPHVAGVVALMVEANKQLNCAQAKEILERTSTDLGDTGKDNTFGAGRVNADKAVAAAKSLTLLSRGDRFEMVVKELAFKITVDANGNIDIKKNDKNDVMPATVTIWVDIPEAAGRKGVYHVNFKLAGPTTKEGQVLVDFDNIPSDPQQYDPKYGFRVDNFRLEKGEYVGSVKSIKPNKKVAGAKITLKGKATWPAR